MATVSPYVLRTPPRASSPPVPPPGSTLSSRFARNIRPAARSTNVQLPPRVYLVMLFTAIRQTLRLIRRSPGFAAVAILTLALGIGANAAVFSVADAMLIEPLPFERSERLVSLWEARTPEGHGSSVAPANLGDYQGARSLSHVAAYTRISKSLTGAGEPEQLRGEAVTWNLFDTLGVRPALGRTFRPEEDRTAGTRVVILTDDPWRRGFGGGAEILG